MTVEIIFGVFGFGGSLDFNSRQTSSLAKFTRGFESRFTLASISERCSHKRISNESSYIFPGWMARTSATELKIFSRKKTRDIKHSCWL